MLKLTKTVFIASSLLFTIALSGCESTKNAAEAVKADSYAEEVSEKPETASPSASKETKKSKKTTDKKRKHNVFVFGNLDKYVLTDQASVFTRGALGGIKQQKSTITVYPEKEVAGFGSPYLTVYYVLFMDQSARQAFKEKFEQYEKDFQAKRLNRNNSNSFKIYGKIPVRIDWGSVKASTPNWSYTNANVGYDFHERSPYFTITIFPADNEHFKTNDAVDRQSLNLKYYFTKAQASQLIDLLSDDKVQAAIDEYYGNFAQQDDYDEYTEASDETTEAEKSE